MIFDELDTYLREKKKGRTLVLVNLVLVKTTVFSQN